MQGRTFEDRRHMHNFLIRNREELVARCKSKVALRPARVPSNEQLTNGIPLFLDQLIRTLAAEEAGQSETSTDISGPSGGDALALSEIGLAAALHGKDLLRLGYSVDQVVHDYGDLCQAITELAFERDAPFAIDEFRTLNRCLDNAIADAVTSFGVERDLQVSEHNALQENLRVGQLAHELRNALTAANLAVRAMELGNLTLTGATGAVLKRSLVTLGNLVTQSLAQASAPRPQVAFSLSDFIAEAADAARLNAAATGCTLDVPEVDRGLGISGNRELLRGALANLLQNAFKFTHFHTEIVLKAYRAGPHVCIEVRDQCGGLPQGIEHKLFTPFTQRHHQRSGVGLGLSIAKQNVVADDGTLTVQDFPGTGCVFTIRLPYRPL